MFEKCHVHLCAPAAAILTGFSWFSLLQAVPENYLQLTHSFSLSILLFTNLPATNAAFAKA
jgi:hypothetical protein